MIHKDRDLCERVCRYASVADYRLRKVPHPTQGSFFEWRSPEGARISGNPRPNEQEALTSACRALQSKMF